MQRLKDHLRSQLSATKHRSEPDRPLTHFEGPCELTHFKMQPVTSRVGTERVCENGRVSLDSADRAPTN